MHINYTNLEIFLLTCTSQAGFVAGLPYLVMAITIEGGGQVADCLRRKQVLSTSVVRKLFNTFGKLYSLYKYSSKMYVNYHS